MLDIKIYIIYGCMLDKRSKSTSYNILCDHLRSSYERIQFLTIDFHVILQTNSTVSTKLFICSVKLYLSKIRRNSGTRPIRFSLLVLNINSLVTNILRGSNVLSSVIYYHYTTIEVHPKSPSHIFVHVLLSSPCID